MIRLETRIIHKYLLQRLSCYFRNHILVKCFRSEIVKEDPKVRRKTEKSSEKLKKINKLNKIKRDFQATINR
jgi:hypothetical protein